MAVEAVAPSPAQQRPAAPQPRRGGVLRVTHVGEPPSLDMQWTSAAITSRVTYNVYEGLFALDRKWQPKPMLLESWSLSRDRLTYTFHLRRGVRFDNGKELASEDVKASIERWGRLSARALGARPTRILARHVLPNCLAPVIVQATFICAESVLAEAALSFLGVGLPPQVASWGTMLSNGRVFMERAPWITLFPGAAILATVLGLNLLGDGLRDLADPRLR